MSKKQDINQIEQILSAKKRRLPVLPIVFISSLIAIIAMLYFDIFNIFGSEVKEVEYKNEYVVVEKANMATTLTSSVQQKKGPFQICILILLQYCAIVFSNTIQYALVLKSIQQICCFPI